MEDESRRLFHQNLVDRSPLDCGALSLEPQSDAVASRTPVDSPPSLLIQADRFGDVRTVLRRVAVHALELRRLLSLACGIFGRDDV